MYECISGRSAFGGSSVIEIGAQVIHVEPPPPSKFNPRVPAELDRITMKALAKKAEERFQSAEEMLADLRPVLATLTSDNHGTPRISPLTTPPATVIGNFHSSRARDCYRRVGHRAVMEASAVCTSACCNGLVSKGNGCNA
jgi:serine/threonine protein kinase